MNAVLPVLRVVGLLLMVSVLGGVLPFTSNGASARPIVAAKLEANLDCLPTGGADVTFTIRNRGPEALRIVADFHLIIEVIRPREPLSGSAAFVFPAPGFDVIPPDEARTWLIAMGAAEPDLGEPGTDLSGRALRLEAEVWFEGRERPVRRTFAFRACAPPA